MNKQKDAINALKKILPDSYTRVVEKEIQESMQRAEDIAHMGIVDIFKHCKKETDIKLN